VIPGKLVRSSEGACNVSARVTELELSSLLEEREQLLLAVARSAASLLSAQQKPTAAADPNRFRGEISLAAPVRVAAPSRRLPRLPMLAFSAAMLINLAAAAWFWLDRSAPFGSVDQPLISGELDEVVERIIAAESHGGDSLSQRSSAAGPAQFLAGTWLEVVRAYRPDLMKDRSPPELLSMRRDPQLARYMTKRLLEKHAVMLQRHRLPVTASTLYLGHFAGGAGAIAVLSAAKSADAARVLARADATGKVTREKIVAANPFLEHYTIGDLQDWASRKMGKPTAKSWWARILPSPVIEVLGKL
jgi:hypothetical protein